MQPTFSTSLVHRGLLLGAQCATIAWFAAVTVLAGQPADEAGSPPTQSASLYVEQLDPKNNPDIEVRRRAAYLLGQTKSPSPQVVAALAGALSDPQMETRWYAIDALGRFGPDAAAAVPAIVKSLESTVNDATVRRRGARSLGRIGRAAKAASPVLAAALASDDRLYRAEAALALWRIDRDERAVPILLALLREGDVDAAFAAALALAELNDDSSATVNALVQTLGHADADVRQAAAHALVQIGPPAIRPLSAVVSSSSKVNAHDAATALGMILAHQRGDVLYNNQTSERQFAAAAEPIVRAALPALSDQLASGDEDVRTAAALAMAKAGSVSIPELLKAVGKEDAARRTAAATALARLEAYLPRQRPLPDPLAAVHRRIVELLVSALADEQTESRRAAVRLFVALQIGPEGAAAEPHLQAALQSSDLATRRYADKALKRLKTEDGRP